MKGLFVLVLLFVSVYCQIPADGSIIPCDLLYLRKDCGQDFVCGSFELQTSNEQYMPIPECLVRSTNAVPADLTRVVTFTFKKLYGVYPSTLNSANNFSEVHLYIDGLKNGLALGMELSYDWSGDGTYDRIEIANNFATDNIPANYQDTNRQVVGTTGLVSATGAWSNFVGGTFRLRIWQAFVVANGTINLGTNKRSFIRIPHVSTYALPGGTIAGCAMNSTTAPATNKVAFVLETVQDFYQSATTQAIMDVFKQAGNISLTIAVIAAEFGTDSSLKSKINTALLDPVWNLEVACNGWNYEDISLLSYNKQFEATNNCSAAVQAIFNNKPVSFVAPVSSESTYVIRRAVQAAGFTHFNTLKYADPSPYALKNSLLYRFPSGATTYSSYHVGAPAATTFAEIQAQLTSDGFAVVSMTPAEFSTGVDDVSIDTNQTAQLLSLLNMVKANNYKTVTLSEINVDAPNKTKAGISPSVCNCVAFRLDDIQDYFLATAQKAVIDTFRRKLAPLTIGIIGNYYGIANAGDPGDMTQYVLATYNNATLTPCFDLEIAHHGWLHEDFSAIDQTTQISRLNSAINRIVAKTGVRPKTFLPPFNLFNQFTVPALNNTAIATMTSQTDLDVGPFDYNNRPYGIWRFPIGASTSAYQSDDYFLGVPATTTFSQIKSQIDTFGWSAVMMHPQEYTDRYANKTYIDGSLLTSQINELEKLIDLVREAGYRMVLVGDIQNYFGRANETDPCRFVGTVTTGAPTTAIPTTSQATTGVPTTSQATTSQATTSQATTSQSTTSQSTTAQSTTSAAQSTTSAAQSTNAAQSSQSTTSVASTVVQATTAVATTAQSTTGAVSNPATTPALSTDIESNSSILSMTLCVIVLALYLL